MSQKRRKSAPKARQATNHLTAEMIAEMDALDITSESHSPETSYAMSHKSPEDVQRSLPGREDRTATWVASLPSESTVTTVPEIIRRQARREELVCIQTTKNPQKDKPLHEGKITSFSQLFKNSFLLHHLYDPDSRGLARDLSQLPITVFDGTKIEDFPTFESLILMKIVNNTNLDFDGKYLLLLNHLKGSPLSIAEVFTETMDMTNFVHAIEALWYAYGEPSKFRDMLVIKLYKQEPVDLQKPETLITTASLIDRILRAFNCKGEELAETFLNNSIKMTEETKSQYSMWLAGGQRRKNLKHLQIWLEYSYQTSFDD